MTLVSSNERPLRPGRWKSWIRHLTICEICRDPRGRPMCDIGSCIHDRRWTKKGAPDEKDA